MIAKTLRDIFIYSKNDSFKVVGDTLAMNTPLTPNQLPLRTLLKIQPKLFIIKLVQKTPSFRVQDVSA
ncbi:hypothetical protein EC561_00195 [Helicobacter pylori]|uniref:hypothetical protein n=1 Tax=Helicobacter pylori TaxID=210 RepID=UPI000FDF2B10|nr:hypothetical protein [Helicobacter pylori]RVZ13364.1 hypothetical protein EC527_00730 [Helicobacter pylori]RVZ29626.1 hypothetical protein EC540_00735 [Helicobacter pylori]RVZ55195.1 hypothetical protein EC561_00195 [Helicobacter pylori]